LLLSSAALKLCRCLQGYRNRGGCKRRRHTFRSLAAMPGRFAGPCSGEWNGRKDQEKDQERTRIMPHTREMPEMQSCLKACHQCFEECEYCAEKCIGMAEMA